MSDAVGLRRGLRAVVICASMGVAIGTVAAPTAVRAQTVHAVLFHSPSCPHCRQVIGQDLPIFFQIYGGQPRVTEDSPYLALVTNGELEMLLVDVTHPEGDQLYRASLLTHPVAEDHLGVPRLIVGDSVLVGDVEIPSRLHAIIRAGLAAGGVPWPAIPGIAAAVKLADTARGAGVAGRAGEAGGAAGAAAPTTAPAATAGVETGTAGAGDTVKAAAAAAADTERAGSAEEAQGAAPPRRLEDLARPRSASLSERLGRDPVGNGLAIVCLVLMIGVVVATIAGAPARLGPRTPGLWMPLLAVVGAGVAGYLTYIETSGVRAVCGPVGDCNTVQQSPYAVVFGVPVGLLGLVGYGTVLVLWVMSQGARPMAARIREALLWSTMAGTLFSLYLTSLEPFVIGATCMWCLTSALIMTALLWLSAASLQVPAGK